MDPAPAATPTGGAAKPIDPNSYYAVNGLGSRPYTVKGEKEWQAWAGENNWELDDSTIKANKRLPYVSTVQIEDGSFVPTWNVRGEKHWLGYA